MLIKMHILYNFDSQSSFLSFQCPECDWVANATLPLIELDAVNVIPRITAGFHQRLHANTVVLKRSLTEFTKLPSSKSNNLFITSKHLIHSTTALLCFLTQIIAISYIYNLPNPYKQIEVSLRLI